MENEFIHEGLPHHGGEVEVGRVVKWFVFEPFDHTVQSGHIHHPPQWPLGGTPSNFQRERGGRGVGDQECRPSSKITEIIIVHFLLQLFKQLFTNFYRFSEIVPKKKIVRTIITISPTSPPVINTALITSGRPFIRKEPTKFNASMKSVAAVEAAPKMKATKLRQRLQFSKTVHCAVHRVE